MDALQALLERVSVPRLTEPAPHGEIRQKIFAAALRAPDHGQLRPWQFLVVEGQARDELGEVFVQAMQEAAEGAMTEEQLQPMRAPLLIVVAAKITEGKIPNNEQLLSAGAAAYAISLAAYAAGFGCVWRTGGVAYLDSVKSALGLNETDEIVAYLYMGTPAGELKKPEQLMVEDYFKNWGNPS
jgi:nitroreductase